MNRNGSMINSKTYKFISELDKEELEQLQRIVQLRLDKLERNSLTEFEQAVLYSLNRILELKNFPNIHPTRDKSSPRYISGFKVKSFKKACRPVRNFEKRLKIPKSKRRHFLNIYMSCAYSFAEGMKEKDTRYPRIADIITYMAFPSAVMDKAFPDYQKVDLMHFLLNIKTEL